MRLVPSSFLCVWRSFQRVSNDFLPRAGVIPITPDSRRVGHKLQTDSMIGLVSCILALNHGSSVPSASRGTAFGRRAVALGGSLALTASASLGQKLLSLCSALVLLHFQHLPGHHLLSLCLSLVLPQTLQVGSVPAPEVFGLPFPFLPLPLPLGSSVFRGRSRG